ncbi:hypothetical protein TCON_0522 [Astathelohania contejeani]|uniref:Uncharacterized protein n=1 Tax=Astathelohania contejeani TaxID=164912 RepID=A0ABQ7I1J9_9MICR|nr:hypothetical protein TCON_0522 [Thelohania contejeani]
MYIKIINNVFMIIVISLFLIVLDCYAASVSSNIEYNAVMSDIQSIIVVLNNVNNVYKKLSKVFNLKNLDDQQKHHISICYRSFKNDNPMQLIKYEEFKYRVMLSRGLGNCQLAEYSLQNNVKTIFEYIKHNLQIIKNIINEINNFELSIILNDITHNTYDIIEKGVSDVVYGEKITHFIKSIIDDSFKIKTFSSILKSLQQLMKENIKYEVSIKGKISDLCGITN